MCFFLLLSTILGKVLWLAHNRSMPSLPTAINFPIKAKFSNTMRDEPFILLDHLYGKKKKRMIVFCSEVQFTIMCRSKRCYMDGTFSVTPKLFKQTYIVQCYDEKIGAGMFSGELSVLLKSFFLLLFITLFH